MTKYSVYNHGTRTYDYYEGPGSSGTHAGAPPIRTGNRIGPAPEQAAWPLPPGAQRVGSGILPQGRIATDGSLDGFDMPGGMLGYGVLAFLLWRVCR